MKILIADDHTIVRKGVKALLSETYPFTEITIGLQNSDTQITSKKILQVPEQTKQAVILKRLIGQGIVLLNHQAKKK